MKIDHEDFESASKFTTPRDEFNQSSDRWHSDWQNAGSASCRSSHPLTVDALVAQRVRLIQHARANRCRLFDPQLFADPAWDILLDLFACNLEQQRVTVSGLSAASGVPATTAVRWMATLEERELIVRRCDPSDAHRVFVMLSDKGVRIMREYFQSLSPDIYPI